MRYQDPDQAQFIQPDTKIPNAYNPQDLNKYQYVRNNPYKYVDLSGNEPIRSEFVGADTIVTQMKNIEETHPSWNSRQVLAEYASNYRSPSNAQGSSKGFIYTNEKGFIDTQHFFVNANYGSLASQATGSKSIGFIMAEQNAIETGYAFESAQTLGFGGKESSYSYEDLSSNTLGASFGSRIDPNVPLSKQFSSFASKLGASNDPLADIPSDILDTIPETPNSAIRGTYLPSYKQKLTPFGRAIPKNPHTKSFFGLW